MLIKRQRIKALTILAAFGAAYSSADDFVPASNSNWTQDLSKPAESVKSPLNLTLTSALRNRSGQICISIFNQEVGFPSQEEKSIAASCYNAAEFDEKKELNIDGLPFGNYAFAVFHDENMDKRLNTGIFGIPVEGFAFSNNPGLRIGAPSFQECAFLFTEGLTTQRLEFRYLR